MKNKSVSVKTLHTILRFNIKALEKQHKINILYTDDDLREKSRAISQAFKNSDRVIFLAYSASVDNESIDIMLSEYPNSYHGVVFPAVTEGIDWTLFKKKIREGSTEPPYQMGLGFDTEVDKPIKNSDLWSIKTTNPNVWAVDTKPAIKTLRERKGDGLKIPLDHNEIFTKIKMCAYTKARITLTYTHECLGNILESSGITRS